MKINCKIADDLLPLYLEDSCSEDSRVVLEEHLQECPSCRAKLDRMRSVIAGGIGAGESMPKLAEYAKKIRNHRICVAVSAIFMMVIASGFLALVYLTIQDMRMQSQPHVFEVEAGTYNLTAGSLAVAAEEISQYILYTNSEQISVNVRAEGSFRGTVILMNAADNSVAQSAEVTEKKEGCIFTNLSAAVRYRIACTGLDGTELTVSDGRTVSFWHSLKSVLSELTGR